MAIIEQQLIIDGQITHHETGEYIDVISPSTADIIGHTAAGSEADVNKAVAAAKAAFDDPAWRDMLPSERAGLLQSMLGVVVQHAEELMYLESIASGACVSRLLGFDIPMVVKMLMDVAGWLPHFRFVDYKPVRVLPEAHDVRTEKEPLGVVAAITAWNWPIALMMLKVIPAIATGNTVVVKPSEVTSIASVRLVELLQSVLPKGVLNIVTGYGDVVGEALITHPDVAKVAFTGSTAVGKHIHRAASDTLKHLTLELGGKGPALVLSDADIELTAHGATWGYLLHGGQVCISGTRLLVPDELHDSLVERLVELAGTLVVGDPLDRATTLAPMSSAAHMNRVLGYIDKGKAEGATLACGGTRMTVTGFERGYFIEPTIFTNVDNSMTIAREEVFGPVLTVIRYSDVDEAIAIANDSCYGLAAGIWTGDPIGAQKYARRLQAGTVWVNEWTMVTTDAPFGGHKQSGVGTEFSIETLDQYLQSKVVITSFERHSKMKRMQRLVFGGA